MEPCTKDIENKLVSFTTSDSTLLHCGFCSQLLSDPVYQCGYAHLVCFECGPKLNYMCCDCPLRLEHSRAIKLLRSIKISCPNEKYGCMKSSMNYFESKKHKCLYVPSFCPISGCDFAAPSKVFSDHFIHKHGDIRIQFFYDISFSVSLKSNDEAIILQEQNDGKLFILNNSNVHVGNAVNISFNIGPNSYGQQYGYKILARYQTCSLKLQSFTKSIQPGTLEPLSSEYLVIPSGCFGSSKAFRLEICISSEIQNVKEQILDKEGIPSHQVFNFQKASNPPPCPPPRWLTPNRKMIKKVEGSDTIDYTKDRIQDKEGFSSNH